MSRREAWTSDPPVKRASVVTSCEIQGGSRRDSAAAGESNSASARMRPSSVP